MNEERVSEKPREILLHFLQQYYEARRLYGQSFYALNSKATVYFRYSKLHGDKYFFGVEADDLAQFQAENTFILFICGDEKRVIVLPAQDFLDMVSEVPSISNQWKVNVSERDGKWFIRVTGKGRFEVSGFLNFYDFTQKDLRNVTWPEVGEFLPLAKKAKAEGRPASQSASDVALELIVSGRDSAKYSVFEKNVTRALVELGFEAERLGGPGATDVIVKQPIRAILDCKSTSSGSLSQVNFTRIKRHQKENGARFCAVVSEDFDPAVVKDAEVEGVALIRTALLADLLRLSLEFPVGPVRMAPLFEVSGLATQATVQDVRAYIGDMKERANRVVHVCGAMDCEERTLEEIRGRLAGKELGDYSLHQVKEAVDFLCSPVLDVACSGQAGFSLKLSASLAGRRIKAVLGALYPRTTGT